MPRRRPSARHNSAVAPLTRDQAANALRLFETQDLASQNLLSSGFHGPTGAEDGRRMYLSWHAQAEQFLRDAGGTQQELEALDTRRHRDLVNNVVDPQQMYREVESEVLRTRIVLSPVVERLTQLTKATTSDTSASAAVMQQFTSDQGRVYRYNPGETLGQGSLLTQVFRGEDADGQPVAVKRVIIRLDTDRRRKEEPLLAEREVEIARELREAKGKHLVPVLDTAHLDGELLLVMPLADHSLASRIAQSGTLSSDEVRDLLLAVAQAMQELAVAGVLHRDIKPHNILWYQGHWCLADFGTSRIVDTATASVSWRGSGTPEYKAPELHNGQPETVLSDMYALGLSALEALNGSLPITGENLRQEQASLVPDFPEGTDPMVRRAIAELLQKDPGARPSDARRIVELLRSDGAMSDAQRRLQSLRASQIEKALETGAVTAEALEHSGLQRQARFAFMALWRRVIDSATRAVYDATHTEDGDLFSLTVGDAELRVHLGGLSKASLPIGPLLMVAEVYVAPAGQSRIAANLYCTNESGVPRWWITRHQHGNTNHLTGDSADVFPIFWRQINSTIRERSREADADALLDLLSAPATGDASTRPSDRIDEIQNQLDEQNTSDTQDEDRIIAALGEEVSFFSVAGAMGTANKLDALAEGQVTLRASLEPRIDITFSWQYHMGDGRFSTPSGEFLNISAWVDAELGGGTPVIEENWKSTETPTEVASRINAKLRAADRWNGPKTINWAQVFRDLHRAIVLAVAYKRRDPYTPWTLHGGMYELHGEDWAITEAGIEYRQNGQVVLAEHEFPDSGQSRARMTSTDLGDWSPLPPDGADSDEWQHVVWRGLWHFPIRRGPVVGQRTWWPSRTVPQLAPEEE